MAVFGENLVLTRRIEAALGDTTITVEDRVENRGFRPPRTCCSTTTISVTRCSTKARSCWCRAGRSCTRCTATCTPRRRLPHPGPAEADFSEQVYEHDVVAGPDGMASALLINPRLGAGGFGIRLDYDRGALPCLIQWQCLQSGLYVLGIEPSTNHVLGRKFAEERGELMFLEHAETRHYRTRLSVLDGAAAIAAARRAIEALHPPPATSARRPGVPQTRRPSMTEVLCRQPACAGRRGAGLGRSSPGAVVDRRRTRACFATIRRAARTANSACPSASAASRCGKAAA